LITSSQTIAFVDPIVRLGSGLSEANFLKHFVIAHGGSQSFEQGSRNPWLHLEGDRPEVEPM
jgi:hypothetical protein